MKLKNLILVNLLLLLIIGSGTAITIACYWLGDNEISVRYAPDLIVETNTLIREMTERPEDLIEKHRGDLPYAFVLAVIMTESDGVIRPKSNLNYRGLMQISSVALTDYNNRHRQSPVNWEDLIYPENNIKVGCYFLNWCSQQIVRRGISDPTKSNFWENVYAMYNVGYGNFLNYYDNYYSNHIQPNGRKYKAVKRYKNQKNIIINNEVTFILGENSVIEIKSFN